jgi:hypothetical protein
MDAFRRDPVLRLLPIDLPNAFSRLSADEQAWRGRLWLTLFGAGYEPNHAWWFAMSDESDIGEMKATVAQVSDDDFTLMVQGRLAYEAGKVLVAEVVIDGAQSGRPSPTSWLPRAGH